MKKISMAEKPAAAGSQSTRAGKQATRGRFPVLPASGEGEERATHGPKRAFFRHNDPRDV